MICFLILGLATVANAGDKPISKLIDTKEYTWEFDGTKGYKYRYELTMPDNAPFPEILPFEMVLSNKVKANNWEIEHIVGYDDVEFTKELEGPAQNPQSTRTHWNGTWHKLEHRPYYFEIALHRNDPIQQARYHAIEEAMLKDVNEQRARHGLRPLLPDLRLFRTARSHCAWMTRNGMVHGSYPVAENIAMGQRSNREVINTWMNSSGHRANILNAGYRCFGCSAFRIGNTTYWCQQFTP
jgi:uncharacterized protein YkwD